MKLFPPAVRVFLLCMVANDHALECRAQSFPSQPTGVIEKNCFACHDGEVKEGGLDLQSLVKRPITRDTLETWVRVHDRVRAGEMPPDGESRPDASTRSRFLKSVSTQIIETERRMLEGTGRSVKRRLNRYEYENSLRDLLSLPHLAIKDSLPEDRTAHGFNKSGEALDVSHVQLARYLRVAETALRAAVVTQVEKPKRLRKRFYAWDQLKFTRGNGPPIRKTYPVLGYDLRHDLNVRPADKPGKFIRPLPGDHSDPARRDEEAVITLMSTYEHVEIQFDEFRAPSNQIVMNKRNHSSGPFVPMRQSLSRRSVLRGSGVALALPWLDAMRPAFAARSAAEKKPRRMLAICNNLGLLPDLFFPEETGFDYPLSPYLQTLDTHRKDFTVFSGVSHPDVDGGHPADNCFLTAAPHPASGRFKNTISLDQLMAERIGHQTRFPSFTLGVNVQAGVRSLSWTESGVMIPCDQSAAEIFKRMFVRGTAEETRELVRKLELGQSILDAVAQQAKSLGRNLGKDDKQRIDQYASSIRDLEKRIEASKAWESRPKPTVDATVPLDPQDPSDYMEKVRLMYEISRLAFQTDSTRVISLLLDGVNSPAIEVDGKTVTDGYHNLSHHGRSKEKLKQLEVIDKWHMKLLAELFDGLKAFEEDGEPLLDRTMVVYGSNLGNAHAHTCLNLPTLFAGGGFRHGQHLAFDTQRNYPLPNLFVSMLQRMNIETDSFASSTGTMRGLEFTG